MARTFVRGEFISLRVVEVKGRRKFHFVVGQKISKKATDRNRIKRRLREAILKLGISPKEGTETFIMPTPEIVNKSFEEIKNEVENIFRKAHVL